MTDRISSADVELNVQVSGPEDGPVAVLVHGFPDNSTVWSRVVADLEADHRVVTYDVRGAGKSTAPTSRSGYRVARLVDDLVAVLDHVTPDDRPVHLVGHDWGSIQLWSAVMREDRDARLTGRIASFTSISGPGLDQVGRFLRESVRHGHYTQLLGQALRAWHVGAFQVPLVPELVFSRLGGPIRSRLEKSQHLDGHWDDASFRADARRGVNLYRANRPSLRRATTSVPVQLIVPTKDPFVTPAVLADVSAFAPDLRRIDVVANHWVVRNQPDRIAGAVRTFVRDVSERETAQTGA